MTLRALGPEHREAWERLAASRPESGFMQSWAWSEFKELEGYELLRLGLFDGQALRGGCLAYAYPSPAEAGLVAVPDGPILDWQGPGAAADLARLVKAVRGWAPARRAVAVRVEPRLEALPPALAGLPRAPVDLVPEETWVVPVLPEAAMLAAMKQKARYNARLSERRGVTVTASTDPADASEFYFVFEQTARFQGFDAEPKSFFLNLASTLMPKLARFHFARYKGITLAAALTLRHGSGVTYLYGGHLPLFRNLMAGTLLHWEILREAAREGFSAYDLYGYVEPGHPGHPYDRFSRFKEKLGGGRIRRIGSRDIVLYDRLAEAALAAFAAGEGA